MGYDAPIDTVIRTCGQSKTLMAMFYYNDPVSFDENGDPINPRLVEPYSYRETSGGTVFYAYDLTGNSATDSKNGIKSFKVDRITWAGVDKNRTTYSPRFDVEL